MRHHLGHLRTSTPNSERGLNERPQRVSTPPVNEEQRAEEFKEALRAFLSLYDRGTYKVEIEAEDHYSGYPECGQDIRMQVYLPGLYGEVEIPSVTVDLGKVFP